MACQIGSWISLKVKAGVHRKTRSDSRASKLLRPSSHPYSQCCQSSQSLHNIIIRCFVFSFFSLPPQTLFRSFSLLGRQHLQKTHRLRKARRGLPHFQTVNQRQRFQFNLTCKQTKKGTRIITFKILNTQNSIKPMILFRN